MRDLEADLKQVRNFRSKWGQSTSQEDTWRIGVAWEYFCRRNAELWLEQALAEKERADKYEGLVRELVEDLESCQIVLDDISGSRDIATWKLIARTKEVPGMKIKLVLARMRYNPEIAWTETKTVEVELPINEKGDWEVIGAEWSIGEASGNE